MTRSVSALNDRDRIGAWLRRDVDLHLYEIGDLDDFFWPRCSFYGLVAAGEIEAIAMLYRAGDLPVLLALASDASRAATLRLLSELADALPPRMYSHLTPGLRAPLERRFVAEPRGRHLKMSWVERERVREVDTSGIVGIREDQAGEALAFYEESYPGHWFDPRMLATERYFGVREEGRLIALGGLHVHSPAQRVAAIGNVTTLPRARGRGLATRVAARICAALEREVDHVGLNVESDNHAAIACYRKLGFRDVAVYDEAMLVARGP